MRRALLYFTAGVIAAMGICEATEVIACCFQPSENAPLIMTELRIDGEPVEIPEQIDRVEYNLSALWDGVQLSALDEQGYQLGTETYTRRVR
jgi:hypothetical protein